MYNVECLLLHTKLSYIIQKGMGSTRIISTRKRLFYYSMFPRLTIKLAIAVPADCPKRISWEEKNGVNIWCFEYEK